ncbi:MAG: bifunctional salicylyl-CoA 5-hydroxylase/oxidoreductase, partial [Candidatus Promineifilaceae bacterium]
PHSQAPLAMGRPEMEQAAEQFAAAAGRAAAAGFDLLALNMAHGYLLSSFLSPLTNRRNDDYGGRLENRLRFPLELFERVRAAWPAAKPLAVVLNASDCASGGLEPAEAALIAGRLKAAGCDLLEVAAGQTTPDARPAYGPGFLSHYSEHLHHEAGIPTLVDGYLTTSGAINTLLAAGRADLCFLTPTTQAGRPASSPASATL